VWSSSYSIIKIGLETIPALSLVAGRMVVGACFLYLILKFKGLSLPMRLKDWGIFFIVGLLGNVIPFFLISYGEGHVDSGLAAVMMGIAPVVTVLLAHYFVDGESLTGASIGGVVLGVCGLFVLFGGNVLEGVGGHIWGQVAITLAALCYALCTVYVRKFVKLPALIMATGSVIVGAISILPFAIIDLAASSGIAVSTTSITAVVYLGVCPTAMAALIYFYLMPHLGAGRMSQINFLVPVFGAFIGVMFMYEPFTPTLILVLAIILIAIYLVNLKPRKPSVISAQSE
jgi:drug/metabolite transporter (DMT)-like permease